MVDLKKLYVTKQVDGVELAATVSPCSWMYPGYGLQITVLIKPEGGSGILLDKAISFEKATESDVKTLLDRVRTIPCKNCGKTAFDPTSISTNRESKCEPCFLAKLNAEFAAAQAAEKRKFEQLDAEHKAAGSTHRVDAWIHPSSGGDDRQISFYLNNPTDRRIKSEIKKAGSAVLNDYKVIPL